MSILRAIFCSFLVAAAIGASSVAAECRDTGIDPAAVDRLINADDVAALDAAFTRVGAKDAAYVAVYRNRRLALSPGAAEGARFLRGLPKTQADLKRVHLLTTTREVCDHPVIAETVYGMFSTAARVVHEQGKSHKALFDVVALAEGDMASSAKGAVDWLLETDPAGTLAAVRALPEATRTGMCHGSDPRKLKTEDALAQCRSEM